MEDEIWLPVVGYEDSYAVSNLGRVKSLPREVPRGRYTMRVNGRQLRPGRDGRGYLTVVICAPGVQVSIPVQTLVLAAFVGPRPEGHMVLHKNDIKSDNRVGNLYYGTKADNGFDRSKNNGYRYSHDDIRNLRAKRTAGAKLLELAAEYGCSEAHVSKICLMGAYPHA